MNDNELNALAAEKVLGCKPVFERDTEVHIIPIWKCPCIGERHGTHQTMENDHAPIPRFTTDLNATMRLVEALQNQGWCVDINDDSEGGWDVILQKGRREGDPYAVTKREDGKLTLARAITITALRAVGVDVK